MRELSKRTRQIVQEVNDSREPVEVTLHGRVLARLVPPPRTHTHEEIQRALDGLREARRRITEVATTETDTSTLMAEERE